MFGWLRRAGVARPIVPVAVQPGDDVVLALPNLLAGEDAITLIDALQAQFPKNRVHLLVGFGSLQVHCKNCRADSSGGADEGGKEPSLSLSDRSAEARKSAPGLAEKAVVLTNYCSVGRIVIASVPPEQQG